MHNTKVNLLGSGYDFAPITLDIMVQTWIHTSHRTRALDPLCPPPRSLRAPTYPHTTPTDLHRPANAAQSPSVAIRLTPSPLTIPTPLSRHQSPSDSAHLTSHHPPTQRDSRTTYHRFLVLLIINQPAPTRCMPPKLRNNFDALSARWLYTKVVNIAIPGAAVALFEACPLSAERPCPRAPHGGLQPPLPARQRAQESDRRTGITPYFHRCSGHGQQGCCPAQRR